MKQESTNKMELRQKIDSIKNVPELPKNIIQLMHEIKNLGNAVAHDFTLGKTVGEQGKRDILIKLREFLNFFLKNVTNIRTKEQRCLYFYYKKEGCKNVRNCRWPHVSS